MTALQTIQQKLKAPKSQYNLFGKYHFRNAEDIQEALKPLLAETNSELIIPDKLIEIGGHLFIESTATLTEYTKDGMIKQQWAVPGYAKHSVELKGMQDSQITGATSSYARKYALNGLFLLDDSKDADATNDHKTESKASTALNQTEIKPPKTQDNPWLNEGTKEFDTVKANVLAGTTSLEKIKQSFRVSKAIQAKLGL